MTNREPSLGWNSELMVASIFGRVDEFHDGTLSYKKISTPSNPDYRWGNYLLFNAAPTTRDCPTWIRLFEKHFGSSNWFQSLGFQDSACSSDCIHAFESHGFLPHVSKVYRLELLTQPMNFNPRFSFKELVSDHDWNLALENHLNYLCEGPYKSQQEIFERWRFLSYQQGAKNGFGKWYGLFDGPTLVCAGGLFHNSKLARYQEVLTNPRYRRQGACRSFTYLSAKELLSRVDLKDVVVFATEPDAISSYKACGFKFVENCLGFEKFDPNLPRNLKQDTFME